MPRKPTKRTLTKKLDILFSKIVRSKGYCVKCGKTSNLQAAHIYSRRYRSVRWDWNNVLCLCSGCHFWSHHNPILFTEWVAEYLGEHKYIQLKLSASMLKKWSLGEMIDFYEDLKRISG